jgi:acetylornithine deacetylase/succinyl-diaminopimelate desuccinylase-like protein
MAEQSWQTYLEHEHDRHFAELLELLRIPSVSTDPEHRPDVAKAAEWVANRLRSAGVPVVDILPTAGHPVVFGRWHHDPALPTLLIYGHYDVQPPDPLELWETPPFEPSIRDGLIYARGSADMKANLLTLIQAVEAHARTHGRPPVNLIFLLEGEEEIGSPNLPAVIRTHRDQLACDAILSADGGMYGPDAPSLVVALKGIAGCQVDIRTGSTDLHSGSYGAVAPNAVQTLVQLAATMHDREGRVAIAGFYDQVRPLTDQDRAELAAVPFDERALLEEAGVDTLWGEPEYTPLERRWTRPTLDFNGIWGGFQGEGTKTVTPCEAHLKITCRLVPDQEPDDILRLIERHVAEHTPAGIHATVRPMPGSARPFSIRRDDPALAVARQVLSEIYGREPLFIRAGGSVPITEVFQRELGKDTVTIGFGMPGSRAHAPNEWFRTADFPIARKVYARFLEALGQTGRAAT